MKTSIFVSVLSFVFLIQCHQPEANNQAFIRNDVPVLNPVFRRNPMPAGNQTIKTNPPVFLIPLVDEKETLEGGIPEIGNPVFYSFRLSQDETFSQNKTIKLENNEWAVFNPHKKLESGKWFWQYKSNKTDWSGTLSFLVSDEVPVNETPDFDELFEKIPRYHPRVLVPDGNINELRTRNQDNEDFRRVILSADKMLLVDPPAEQMGITTKKGSTKAENSKLSLDASNLLGSLVEKGSDPLVKAYILTGDEKYARAAIKWALKVASFDPDGVSMTSNFGDSQCMLQMAYVFDACFDLLNTEEKELLLSNITIRAERFYNRWKNMLEAKVFSGHIWQHILERLFKTSLAVMLEVPQAKTWMNFIYDVYLARSPVLGTDDGGWWNGNHYLELNGVTLLDIPQYFKLWTGVDFLKSPFYDNVPFWLIYSFPANSYSEGFGNGTEKQFGQKLGVLGFMDALGRIKQNSYASWYADFQLKNGAISEGFDPSLFGHLPAVTGRTIYDDEEFRWFRIMWDLPASPEMPDNLNELPLARAFRETGSVNMHTDLFNAENNLMISMRSSPYGSTSHAHADQNGFNIQFGGEKIFYNSGYRPSMGVPHYEKWFKASIGHNTVLIDGKGQPNGSGESYGWIPRFLNSSSISYALGDASIAYDNEFNEPQKAGMKLFRRHLVLLRPSIIVIYDELEADHAAEWTWLIHSPFEITLDNDSYQFSTITPKAKSRVDQFGSTELKIELGTKFNPEPVNFRELKGPDGNILEYKDQWHIYSRPVKKAKKFRYLTIFQIKQKDDISDFIKITSDNSIIYLMGWKIKAELDVTKEASLSIINHNENKSLMYNLRELTLNGKKYFPKIKGSSMLIEIMGDKKIVKEAIDEFPKGR